MAAKGNSKGKKKPDQDKAALDRKRRSRFILAILGVALIVVLTFVLSHPQPKETKAEPQDKAQTKSSFDVSLPGNIQFKKEGELNFLTTGGIKISKIDIEIAKTQVETEQGLMYRSQMKPDQGMLFIFPYERIQSFWMKNTQIPLDMIFVNSSLTIVTIRADAVPFDESSYASTEPAKFVVEVNAGYAHEHGIKVGDKIKWTESL
jgi:hypothetical protein